jgi:hypothetical protein
MTCASRILQNKHLLVAALGLLVLFFSGLSQGQITPLGDAYTNTADSTTNFGAATLLDVDGAKEITYIQFPLSSIPSGASVSQATLKLYVNAVTTAGSFNVDYVNGAWAESTIDASNAPALGTTIASNVNVTTTDKNQYILINVTSAVQAWLSGSETNDGVALVANGTFNASFDSKESTTTSHPAELDIAYAGGDGTITGVTTASGSGLTGGGTSGTLNLALTNSCAANQILQWSGSAWACATAGTGTITGVTAGTDLSGGGSSGNVTLNLNTSALNSTYAQLAAANIFTANNTISASTTDAIDAYTSAPGATGVYANAGSSTASNGVIAIGATGVAGYTTVNGSIAVYGNAGSSTGSNGVVGYGATGVAGNSTITGSYGTYGSGSTGVWGNSTGTGANVGVYGTSTSGGPGVYGVSGAPSNITPQYTTIGVWGDTNGENSTAVSGTAILGTAGAFVNDSASSFTLGAINEAPSYDTAYAFYAGSPNYGGCYIDIHGNFACSGSKSAVVPVDGGSRKVALYAVEAPENWFEDFGSGQLSNGSARIALEPTFAQTVNTDLEYHVFLTPNGDCRGLYAANKTANSFEVRELGGGRSNISFDYRITAIRRNYETVRLADHTNDPDPGKMLERMREHKAKASSVQVTAKPTLPSPPQPRR